MQLAKQVLSGSISLSELKDLRTREETLFAQQEWITNACSPEPATAFAAG